ncbi:glycoside hydrolase [Rasiella rasia]|uniref:Glycoside hydrolase n=1 Tax=Rasiella rasia TaxID=2744027 RepID=A0A6G6GLJ3_9FLAO|nr:glycoside hydrolase [Rasiella rasia]QIE59422.1 glycoside hydrolase [Rasiella rasia]
MKHLLKVAMLVCLLQSCSSKSQKINGISYVAAGEPTTQAQVAAVKEVHANYAAVMPFGFIRDIEDPELMFNSDRQWYGERREGVKQYIEMLESNGINVMLKPQIWISRGEFTGYLKMNTEEEWQNFEASYREFIMLYAGLAAETEVALFCIGTELEQFIVNRPEFWTKLISEVRTIYKGKLTYAANWDEYKRVPFWAQLDYIGVDAYFPISEEKTPSVANAQIGWQPWKAEMKEVSEANKKPILFTEYGYRSVDFSGKEPWQSSRQMKEVNLDAQNNLMKALFAEVYHEPWFAGGFIWKWFIEHDNVGGHDNPMFTPQNKPVQTVIQEHFKTTQ